MTAGDALQLLDRLESEDLSKAPDLLALATEALREFVKESAEASKIVKTFKETPPTKEGYERVEIFPEPMKIGSLRADMCLAEDGAPVYILIFGKRIPVSHTRPCGSEDFLLVADEKFLSLSAEDDVVNQMGMLFRKAR